jgi:hypothetical protein
VDKVEVRRTTNVFILIAHKFGLVHTDRDDLIPNHLRLGASKYFAAPLEQQLRQKRQWET